MNREDTQHIVCMEGIDDHPPPNRKKPRSQQSGAETVSAVGSARKQNEKLPVCMCLYAPMYAKCVTALTNSSRKSLRYIKLILFWISHEQIWCARAVVVYKSVKKLNTILQSALISNAPLNGKHSGPPRLPDNLLDNLPIVCRDVLPYSVKKFILIRWIWT